MAGQRRRIRSVRREQHVAAREERTRAAGAAEDAIERGHDRCGRGIDFELRAKSGVRDGHHQSSGHPVPRRVAEQHRRSAVGQRYEIVDITTHRVRDAIERRDVPLLALRHLLRNQTGLQIARELQLIAKLHLVDQLHRQEHGHHQEGPRDLDERPERRALHRVKDREEPEKEGHEGKREEDAAMRRESFREAIEHGADGADPAADALRLRIDRRTMLGGEHLLRLRPLQGIEVGHVVRLERVDGISAEVQPVAEQCHGGIVRMSTSGVLREARRRDLVLESARLRASYTSRMRPSLLVVLIAAALAGGAQELPFTQFAPSGQALPLPSASVQKIIQDDQGYIWMGFYTTGIARYDGRDMESYGVSDGLPDPLVRELAEDASHRLWVATEAGLVVSEKPL